MLATVQRAITRILGQTSYWKWIPEIAREMISRWISDVPSKMVQILFGGSPMSA